jgi:hypothetical protein
MKRLLDWRAALVYTHRWLGIAFQTLLNILGRGLDQEKAASATRPSTVSCVF